MLRIDALRERQLVPTANERMGKNEFSEYPTTDHPSSFSSMRSNLQKCILAVIRAGVTAGWTDKYDIDCHSYVFTGFFSRGKQTH